MKIGLTGGVASGKSTVADLLRKKGVKVIDADAIAHQLMTPETEMGQKVLDYFGEDILLSSTEIDRKKLGKIVFNDQAARQKLNEITHPYIIKELNRKMEIILENNDIVVAEVALLIETDMMNLFDEIWVVYANKEVQIRRLINRNNYKQDRAQRQVEAQLPLQKKTKYADRVITNNGSRDELEKKVDEVWQEFKGAITN